MKIDSKRNSEKVSRLLSYILRHKPEELGLELGDGGWVAVEDLLTALTEAGNVVSRDDLEFVVATSDKKRFALSEDGALIRANQGHSVVVELGLRPTSPPARLFHGTVAQALPSIRKTGLVPRSRHHVHLSPDGLNIRMMYELRYYPIKSDD